MNRADADEAEDVALERFDAVRLEVPAIDQRRHAHRHHDAGRAAAEQFATLAAGTRRGECEARAGDLLEEALEQRRHVAEPQREEHDDVLRPGDRLLCFDKRRRGGLAIPVNLRAQQRKF